MAITGKARLRRPCFCFHRSLVVFQVPSVVSTSASGMAVWGTEVRRQRTCAFGSRSASSADAKFWGQNCEPRHFRIYGHVVFFVGRKGHQVAKIRHDEIRSKQTEQAVLLVHKFSTFFQLAHSLIRNIIRLHYDTNNWHEGFDFTTSYHTGKTQTSLPMFNAGIGLKTSIQVAKISRQRSSLADQYYMSAKFPQKCSK